MKPQCAPPVAPRRGRSSQRPSLHWVLRGEFPSFSGTMALCDSLCPSRRASLPSLGDTLRCACGFAPGGPGHQTAGLGFIIRSPLPDIAARRQPGPPRFPDNPLSLCPVLRPRQDRTRQAIAACRHGPRYVHSEGSHEIPAFEAQSHGFRTRCLRFVPCVATRDAKLASGRWPSATGRAWLPAGLLRKVSDERRPPFPSFSWRKGIVD
jgi:hypothetical protein